MSKKKEQSAIEKLPVPVEMIERRIFLIRNHKVMLDSDLAELYGVQTKMLNRSVRRNLERFPDDFMFQLTAEEAKNLRFQFGTSSLKSQSATLKAGYGGRRYLPYVFTQEGVAMLSSVLNSKRAIQVNILIMRVFVKLRELTETHKDLAKKLEDLERKYQSHDVLITDIFSAIRKLLKEPKSKIRPIGFMAEPEKK